MLKLTRYIAVTVFLSAVALVSGAQTKFTYDDLSRGMFSARSVGGARSMNDGEHYTARVGNAIVKYDYATGGAVDTVANMAGKQPFSSYQFSGDERRIMFTTDIEPIYRHSYKAETWIYDIASGDLRRLTDKGKQQVATLSPDGSKVAFVRDNDLYYIDLSDAGATEHRLTFDGRQNHILNGIPDWVYEEEFGFSRAFEWSPDSKEIAYMRFDESRVKEYNMNMFSGELYPQNYAFKYPKAGEDNSVVEVYRHDLSTGQRVKVDIGSEADQYIPRVKWTPAGGLMVYRLNRAQNFFEMLYAYDRAMTRPVYSERNDRYVERVDDGIVTFLPDGDRFIVRSEKDGYMHLYLYSIKDGFLHRITDGDWEVTGVNGISGNKIYYTSTESSPLRRDLYVVGIDGRGKKRLTGGDGTYSVDPSKGFKYYISYFSNASTPNTVTLHKADGKLVRTLEDNAALKAKLREMQVPQKEFFTFETPQGVELNGYMVKPADFDPTKKYPLFMTQYSGPGSQSVADRWGMGWEDALVQDGYIVACVDGRGTGFRGEDFKKCTYLELGKYETEDQIEAARWLGSLPFVDSSRIGIYGWSYGGFMALNCILKGNDVFSLAIAVAPVTNWRYYDTIYTEVYNGKPQDNPSGYDGNSPVNFAKRLNGKLLIAHGTGDDNVHIQNSYEMITELMKAGKYFEMYICPDQNHGMGYARNHLMHKCISFVKDNL